MFSTILVVALSGVLLLLSRFFINNPILYFRELETLRTIGYEPVVFADAKGDVTTPWDMMINQLSEEIRGGARHGSCGVGINETIKRAERYPLTVGDLAYKDHLITICREIISQWVPDRLQALGMEPSSEWLQRLESSNILDTYVEHCLEYRKAVQQPRLGRAALNSVLALHNCKNVVFEGAQGLLLDEDHHFFPHVTHSHTGLKNVMELALDNYIESIDVVYITRAYATRHGAGPFPHEESDLRYDDATNVHNAWQGSIRFGRLDLDLLAESVTADRNRIQSVTAKLGLAVTCLEPSHRSCPVLGTGQVVPGQSRTVPS